MILRKIIKIVATRCHSLKLKCTEFDFGWGSAPDPAAEAYNAPQTLQLDLRGLLLRGRRGEEGKGEGIGGILERYRRVVDREESGWKGREGENLAPKCFVWPRLSLHYV